MKTRENDVVGRLPKLKRIIACALGIAVLVTTQTASNFTKRVSESEVLENQNPVVDVVLEENLRYLAGSSEHFIRIHKDTNKNVPVVSTTVQTTTTTKPTNTTTTTATTTTIAQSETTSSSSTTITSTISTVTSVSSTTNNVSIESNENTITETYEEEDFSEDIGYEESYEYDEIENIDDSSLELYIEEPIASNNNSYSYAVTDSDYILLCNCVAHEAGSTWISESEKAMVAEVILNRVNSPLYPGTIYGVITQNGQFSGCWGYANLGYFSSEVSQSVKNAVSDYLNGLYCNHGYISFWGDGSNNHFS